MMLHISRPALAGAPGPTSHGGLDTALAALVGQWQALPFAWGTVDCCQFAKAAAWQLHGMVIDAPTYVGERDALRTLRALGGYTGLLAAARLLQRPLPQARRGDFVLFAHAGPGLFGQGLGVVTGLHAQAPGATGLVQVRRQNWLQCWGVADVQAPNHATQNPNPTAQTPTQTPAQEVHKNA